MRFGGEPRSTTRGLPTCASLALVLSLAAPARAQESARVAAAEELFREGRTLLAQRRYREACEKLAGSEKLDPAVGTLLSLGDCNGGQGKTASAWLSYRRAVALASEHKDPRSAVAEERANAVEPLLSHLVLRMDDAARAADLRITLNGETLERVVLFEPIPADPGPATIVVSAPGRRAWSTRVQVGALGDAVDVVIPILEPLPDASEIAREETRASTRRTLGLGLGGAGLAALGTGAILGLQAIVKIRDANRLCSAGSPCSNAGAVHENDVGTAFADASTVVLPIGVALVAVGSYLFLTTKPSRAPEIGGEVGAGAARVNVAWSW